MERLPDSAGTEGPQSFVVRIWLEEPAHGTRSAVWRGHVTHVLDGERRYFEDLDAVAAFIRPYLERMGARFGVYARLRRRFRR